MAGARISFTPRASWDSDACARYTLYQIKLRSGWIRARTPVSSWDEPLLACPGARASADPEDYAAYRQSLIAPRFFSIHPTISRTISKVLRHSAEAMAEADDVRDGWFQVLGQPAVWLGTPPDWSALAPLADDAPPPSLDLTEHWTATRP